MSLIALVLSFLAPAFACDHANCDKTKCPMHASTSTTANADVPADAAKATLDVTGMKCGGCSSKVTAALQKVDGVHSASVDHATGKAEVAYDSAKTNVDALVSAVAGAGHFQAKPAGQLTN